MYDLVTVAIGHTDRHHHVDSFGDLGEVRRIQFGPSPKRCGRLPEVLNGPIFPEPSSSYRCVRGIVASISIPIATSAALQDAIACTVCRWL
jgi:hypothetical protein